MSGWLTTNLLALALAVLLAWLWIRRRSVRRLGSRAVMGLASTSRSALRSIRVPPSLSLDAWLFVLATAAFGLTRLISIEAFPIYFFTDEAANTVLAADLVRDGFFDASGHFFPAYFANSEKMSLSLSVYVQVLPYLLFGRSVWVTRATASLIALTGTVAVGLILRDAFRLRSAWLGVLLLSLTPAWWLHSRTAFETSLYVSMIAWSLHAYLRYRQGHPVALLAAVGFAGLAFYSYTTGQAGLLLAALLLAVADAGYHWRHSRTAAASLVLAGLLALPYLRFHAEHPGEAEYRLGLLDSYLVRPGLTISEKAGMFASEYALGLSPFYWYAPDNGRDLIRHRMKGYGNVLWPTLPLALVGLAATIRNRRDPAYRTVLIGALTAPAGAAMAEVQVTRVLVLVIPVAIWSAIGAAELLRRLSSRVNRARGATAVFAVLALASGLILRDALVNGPRWYSDYGLRGMQYGARQVFDRTLAELKAHPAGRVLIFPTWLNGPEMLQRFFAPDEPRIRLLGLDSFLLERYDSLIDALFVLSAPDFRRVTDSGKFSDVRVEETLPLPDGTPGFYFVRMAYSSDADDLFAREHQARRRMVEERVALEGRPVLVRHTAFDGGSAADLLDGDPGTLVRTAAINPAVVEISFAEGVPVSSVLVTAGHAPYRLTLRAYSANGTQHQPRPASFTVQLVGPALNVILDPPPAPVSRIVIEIEDLGGLPTTSIPIYDVVLRGP